MAGPSDRERAFSRLRGYVKSLPHRQAMDWVGALCDGLGVTAPGSSVLGWEELRRLAREGVTLASHTRTHPLLHRISPEELREEVLGSKADLEREIGRTPPVLAYPGGGFDAGVLRFLKEAGFAFAFGTRRGINDLDHEDPLCLRRINVGRRTTLTLLRAQLLPWMVHLDRSS
jgi:peptidoglycan/xylan/chitin deacetylase (PgdA/CDA1 family)